MTEQLKPAKQALQSLVEAKHNEHMALVKIEDKSHLSAIKQIGFKRLMELFDCVLVHVQEENKYKDLIELTYIDFNLQNQLWTQFAGIEKIYAYQVLPDDPQEGKVLINNKECIPYDVQTMNEINRQF